MILESRSVAPFFKNGFVVGCERSREAIVIDPGDDVPELIAAVREHDLVVRYILLTHAHFDHVTGVDAARAAFDAPVYLHRDDLPLYERVGVQGEMFGVRVRAQQPVDGFYEGAGFAFGDYSVEVLHTPGHCPGGVCLEVRSASHPEDGTHLFVGDTLFAGSIGRTDLPGSHHESLMRSIVDVLLTRGDDAVVHPGHGPDTTIGRERATNPFVLQYLASRHR